jgi:hypothetical protein
MCGKPFERLISCRGDEPLVRFRVQGVAPRRVTVTARMETALDPRELDMDTVGGVIKRPRERLYSPTYWPVPSRLTLGCQRDPGQGKLHVLFESSSAVSLGPSGALDWIVARNAQKERAFGFLPVLAHPIGGSNSDVQVHESALLATDPETQTSGEADPLGASRAALARSWLPTPLERDAAHAVAALVHCDAPEVSVTALKRAAAGDGLILRLFCEHAPSAPVRLRFQHLRIRTAVVCDALEQPLHSLPVADASSLVVPLSQRLTSLLLSR